MRPVPGHDESRSYEKTIKMKSLTLLLGPAGTGKTHTCLNQLSEAIQQSEDLLANDILFIIPTAEHRGRTIDLLLRYQSKGFFHKCVTTFDECIHSFLKVGNVSFASSVMRRLILREIISNLPLDYFASAKSTKGFVDLIAGSLSEFKESLIRPADLRRHSKALQKSFPVRAKKYEELSLIYETYEARLQSLNLKDEQDALFFLEEGIQKGAWRIPRFRHIWIDGFFEFSKLQLAFIKLLSAHADQMTVTLTLDHNPARSALFYIPLKTKKSLEQIGFQENWLAAKNHRSEPRALQHVESQVFSETAVVESNLQDTVKLFEAAGLVGELQMIAREIKSLVLEHRYHFSDIALIFRRIGPYADVIRNVFSEFGIPFEIHEREELRLNSLARTLISMFQIFTKGWQREDLMNFLKSGYVAVEVESVWQMELAAQRKGIFSGREYWLKCFDLPVLQKLADCENQFMQNNPLDRLIDFTYGAMREFGLSQLSYEVSDQNRLHHAAFKRIQLLLEEIKRKYATADLTFQSFADILIRLIEVDLFSIHARDKNRVQVYNVSLARQKEYKVVFLPGLLEKQFPIQIKEDPILRDEERRLINQSGEMLPERLPRQSIERLFFYLALTRASERLIFSYPRFDLEGKESLPSFYVDEIHVLFKNRIPVKKQKLGDVYPAHEDWMIPKEAKAYAIHKLWMRDSERQKVISKSRENQFTVSVYNHFLGSETFRRLISSTALPIEGKITDELIRSQFAPDKRIYSPTRLEEYAECPYRYFADQHLMLQAQEETIDARTVGNILHHTLEHFFDWLSGQAAAGVNIDEAREKMSLHLGQAFDLYPISGDRFYKIELKKREIARTLERLLVQELIHHKPPISGLIPQHFEYQFGFSDKKDYLILPASSGDIKFRGKIDRIDIDSENKFALVIDYKTGKKFDKKALQNGTQLQLPLYLLAVKQNLGLEPIGAHLYSLSKTKSSGFHLQESFDKLNIPSKNRFVLSKKEWDTLFEKISFFVRRFDEGIQKAEIPVRPRDCADYCSFSAVCRIEKWRLEYIEEEIRKEDKAASTEGKSHELRHA